MSFVKPEKFTVVRSRWVNGSRDFAWGFSALRNQTGNQCCVGFLAEAGGCTEKEMKNFTLRGIDNDFNTQLDLAGIYRLNDSNDPDLSATKREQLLTEKFKSLGIDVEFVD